MREKFIKRIILSLSFMDYEKKSYFISVISHDIIDLSQKEIHTLLIDANKVRYGNRIELDR